VISLRLEQPKQRESGQILELGRNVDVRRKEWRARSYKMEPAVKRVFIQYSGWDLQPSPAERCRDGLYVCLFV